MDQASLWADVRRLVAEKDVLWAELTAAQELNNDLNAELRQLRQEYAVLQVRAVELGDLAEEIASYIPQNYRTQWGIDGRLAETLLTACGPAGGRKP